MNLASLLNTSLCVRLVITLGHFLWQGLAIFLIAALVTRLLRRASANARYVVAIAGFALMAMSPAATFLLIEASPATVEQASVCAPEAMPKPQALQQPDAPLQAPQGNAVSVPTSPAPTAVRGFEAKPAFDWQRYAPYAVACYLIGAAAMFGRLLLGVYGGRQLRRQSQRLEDETILTAFARQAQALGLRFTPVIAYCQRVAVPTVVGVIRPMILLPVCAASGLDREQLEMLLAHELAHIRRHDHLVNLLQRIVEAVLFFHPAVWLLSRRIRIQREHCCDDRVVAAGGHRFAYAESLLRMAELSMLARLQASGLTSRYAALAALGADGHRSNFHARITRLVAGTTQDGLRLRQTWTLAMPLLFLGVLAIVRAVPAGAAPASKPAPSEAGGDYALPGRVVDEQGRPVSGARVQLLNFLPSPPETTSDPNGAFVLHHNRTTLRGATILASVDDRQGLFDFADNDLNAAPGKPIHIILKPARLVTVEVVDPAGKPIEGASIEVFHWYKSFYTAQTGMTGQARIRIAADLKAQWVIALKSGVGFDYFENYSTWPPRSDHLASLPDKIKLVLDGAQQVRMRAVDSAGQPLPNIWFTPSSITKPGKLNYANLSGSLLRDQLAAARTDASGVAVFDWIPAVLASPVEFRDRDESRYCMESPQLGGPQSGQNLTAKLLRHAHVSGKVLLPDGEPAANVLLQAEGRGATNRYCRRYLRTRADGSYSADLSANQSYIIAVIDETWTAPSRTGLFLREAQHVTGVDFRLAKGTLLRGTVTVGPQDTPAARHTVTLEEIGQRVPGNRMSSSNDRESLVRWTETDENGRYALRVSPGKYKLWSGGEKAEFVVDEEEEIVNGFHAEANSEETKKNLSGRVVDSKDGRPIAGASLYAAPTSRSSSRWGFRGVTNDQGRFDTDWTYEPVMICACDDQGHRAGFALVAEDATSVTIQAVPAARALGRIVDRDGKPVTNQSVAFTFSITADGETADFGLSRGQTMTGADGTFTIGAIPVGARCTISLLGKAPEEVSALMGFPSLMWNNVHEFEVESASVIKLPDLEPGTTMTTTRPG